VWRSGTGEAEVLRDHAARVLAVAYSPDGRWLVTGGEDREALVFETSRFQRVHVLGGHERPIRALAFSRDGTQIATAGDEGIVRVWSIATGGLIRTIPHVAPIWQLALSPDGTVAAVDDQGRVALWSFGALPQLHTSLTNGHTRAIAFSDDGSRLVASGTDTKVFRIQDGVLGDKASLMDGPTGEVRAVTFTRDTACVITAGVDGLVQLWDADKGKLLGTRGTRGAAVNALATSADGSTLWVGGADQLVRAWDIHAEARDVAALGTVMQSVPWGIDDIDVVRRTESEERTDGKHR
jgi:WD40 repeat protein